MQPFKRNPLGAALAVAALLTLFCAGEASAQIAVKGNSITVEQAIRQVERNSGYTFFYNSGDISGIAPKNIDVDGNIETVLSALFRGTGVTYRIQGNEIVLKKVAVQQQAPVRNGKHTVKGQVTDVADGSPIIGAGVFVRGTTTGAFTDVDGRYTVEVGDGAVLEFSYLGYQTVVEAVGGRGTIDVEMRSEINAIEAVVMLGYSSTKKTELSSSVVTVQGDALRDVSTPDVGDMLQGKVAGVLVYNASGQPGESAQIRVRGTGSISASASPLYVVDGIPGGSFNPNDVETITVLKDAGATAIYG
ncbi:MAG: TonB-dependent receptor plug domain-containing protein, partial [Bacteroidales bacterium]|nr:TonB-dependent receptor plug domain-containing protein [Bacteroidales bacterium]